MASLPLHLSPASPSELLEFVLAQQSYPTTLIVCSSREEFVTAAVRDLQTEQLRPDAQNHHQTHQATIPSANTTPQNPTHPPASAQARILSSPLHQVARARHIRLAFVPTVTHLRSYLAVLALPDADATCKIQPPPPGFEPPRPGAGAAGRTSPLPPPPPLLLVYGLVALHRGTSEWSAQGLGETLAATVEAGARLGLRAVVVDARRVPPPGPEEAALPSSPRHDDVAGRAGGGDDTAAATSSAPDLDMVPVLSSAVRRAIASRGWDDVDDGAGWSGRKVPVARVLGRWFRYERGVWDEAK